MSKDPTDFYPNNPRGGLQKLVEFIRLYESEPNAESMSPDQWKRANPQNAQLAQALSRGHCVGFSTLWAYARDLDFRKPRVDGDDSQRFDTEWFYGVLNTLARWEPGSTEGPGVLSETEKKNISQMIQLIRFFQAPFDLVPHAQKTDLNVTLQRVVKNEQKVMMIDGDVPETVKAAVERGEVVAIIKKEGYYCLGLCDKNNKTFQEKPLDRGSDLVEEIELIALLDGLSQLGSDTFNGKELSLDLLAPSDQSTKARRLYPLLSSVIHAKESLYEYISPYPICDFQLSVGIESPGQLSSLLPDLIQDGQMILLNTIGHSTAIRREGNSYQYFDPDRVYSMNDEPNLCERWSSAEDISQYIFTSLDKYFVNHQPDRHKLPLSVQAFRWPEITKPVYRRSVSEILSMDSQNPSDMNDALYLAILERDVESVRYYLDKKSINLEHEVKNLRKNLLMVAAENDNGEIISSLLEAGADINNSKNPNQATALMIAVLNNNIPAVKELIRYGADVGCKRKGFEPGTKFDALMIAAKYNNVEIIKELINAGADIDNGSDSSEPSPLIIAIMYGNVEAVETLLELGANKNRMHQGKIARDYVNPRDPNKERLTELIENSVGHKKILCSEEHGLLLIDGFLPEDVAELRTKNIHGIFNYSQSGIITIISAALDSLKDFANEKGYEWTDAPTKNNSPGNRF